MAAVATAMAALVLLLGLRLSTWALFTIASAWLLEGMQAGWILSTLWGVLALALHDRRQRRRRRLARDGVREILEALSESTRLEADTAAAVRLGLARCSSQLAQQSLVQLATGAAPEDAFAHSEVPELRTLSAVLAHCRRSGTQPAFAFTMLRNELAKTWKMEEETETAVALLRSVSVGLSLAVLLFLGAAEATGFLHRTGDVVLLLLLAGVAFAVLLPRAVGFA